MEHYNINDQYLFNGKWFFPTNKDKTFFGQLSYNTQKKLPLLKFWSAENIDINVIQNNSIFLGNIENGDQITLLGVRLKFARQKSEKNNDGLFTCECNVYGSIIIGKHYYDKAAINFDKIVCSFSGCNNLYISEFATDKELTKLNICTYKKTSYDIVGNHYFQEKTTLEIRSSVLLKYSHTEKLLSIFNNFLIFVTNKRSDVLYISIFDEKKQIFILNYWNQKKELPELNQFMAGNLMFSQQKIPIQDQLLNWLKLYETEETALNKFFYALSTTKYYIQEEFLVYMQIFEDFHRQSNVLRQEEKDSTSLKLTDIDYHKNLQQLIEICSPKLKEWVNDNFSIQNEIKLPARLQEIFKIFDSIFCGHLKIEKANKTKLVNKIVATRNFLTHNSEQSKKNTIFEEINITTVTELIHTIINCMILFEMNYSVKTIAHEIFNKECFHYLIRRVHDKIIDWEALD